MPGNHKSPTLTARLTAREAPDNVEAARLMTQARLLLDQGKIIAARSVLERAAASGSALALFLLAETYDPAILSEWGIFGSRGSVTKAREFYAKAVAGGVHEAKYRLSALR
jgi:TPR repeat protein